MGKTRETANITAENLVSTNITSDFPECRHWKSPCTVVRLVLMSATSYASGNINANGNIVGDTSTNVSGINSVTATSSSW